MLSQVLNTKNQIPALASCYLLAAQFSKTVQLLLFLTGREMVQSTICSPLGQEENAGLEQFFGLRFSQNPCSCPPAALRKPCRAKPGAPDEPGGP
jgi:hypothetical protein